MKGKQMNQKLSISLGLSLTELFRPSFPMAFPDFSMNSITVKEKLTEKIICPECLGKCRSYKHKHNGIECPVCKGSGGI